MLFVMTIVLHYYIILLETYLLLTAAEGMYGVVENYDGEKKGCLRISSTNREIGARARAEHFQMSSLAGSGIPSIDDFNDEDEVDEMICMETMMRMLPLTRVMNRWFNVAKSFATTSCTNR